MQQRVSTRRRRNADLRRGNVHARMRCWFRLRARALLELRWWLRRHHAELPVHLRNAESTHGRMLVPCGLRDDHLRGADVLRHRRRSCLVQSLRAADTERDLEFCGGLSADLGRLDVRTARLPDSESSHRGVFVPVGYHTDHDAHAEDTRWMPDGRRQSGVLHAHAGIRGLVSRRLPTFHRSDRGSAMRREQPVHGRVLLSHRHARNPDGGTGSQPDVARVHSPDRRRALRPAVIAFSGPHSCVATSTIAVASDRSRSGTCYATISPRGES